MTTATTTTIIDQSTDAAFRTWVAEIITALFTTIGLTQTSDTGQINTSTVTRQATVNTAAGYVIGRFNDTAQSTSPIFFKLEFGTGNTTLTSTNMWITVGTGSNGSGTITGTTTTRESIVGGVQSSNSTAYTSYWCYKSAQGYFGMAYKTGGIAGNCFATTVISRSTDSSGAVTTNAFGVLTSTTTNASTQGGQVQIYNFAAAALQTGVSPSSWCAVPFIASATLNSGNVQVFPCWQADPVFGINANYCLAVATEVPLGVTFTAAAVGSTTHTFVSIAAPYGGTFPGSQTNACLCMLYE